MLPGIYPMFQHWAKQTVWVYSDCHFSDEDLAEGVCGRPSDEEQLAMINSCVGRKDTIIILGDVGNIEMVKKMRGGHKVLICGNHDIGASRYERVIEKVKFDMDNYTKEAALNEMKRRYPNCRYSIDEGYDVSHAPFSYWLATADNCLFDEVYTGALIVGEKLILSHEPLPGIDWAMNIHGHIHSRHYKNDKFHFNCCSDCIGYKPINLNQWLKQGHLSGIQSIHRKTIDKATLNKRGRKR